jgi:hypothetical protein
VSIRFTENGATIWPPQSEIKNLNSYQAIREAVPYEAERMWREWQDGGEIRTRKGKITVEFASVDDLERIVGVMAPELAVHRAAAPQLAPQRHSPRHSRRLEPSL